MPWLIFLIQILYGIFYFDINLLDVLLCLYIKISKTQNNVKWMKEIAKYNLIQLFMLALV